jgi:hypothetical protein
MSKIKKPHTSNNSFSNLAFSQLLQDKLKDPVIQTQVNRALKYDYRKFEDQKNMCVKQKKRLKIMDTEYQERKYSHSLIKSENDKFAKSFQRQEELMKLRGKKSNVDVENFERRFKELLRHYRKRGYNVKDLVNNANLFEPSPLLMEPITITNFYQTHKPKKGEASVDIQFLEKMGRTVTEMRPEDSSNRHSKKEIINLIYGGGNKSRNEFPKTIPQMESDLAKLKSDNRLIKENMSSGKLDSGQSLVDPMETGTDFRTQKTTQSSLRKTRIMHTPDQRSTTFQSFSDLSGQCNNHKFSKFKSCNPSSADMTNFTNTVLEFSSIRRDSKIASKLSINKPLVRRSLKLKTGREDKIINFNNNVQTTLHTSPNLRGKRVETEPTERSNTTKSYNGYDQAKQLANLIERQNYLDDVVEEIRTELAVGVPGSYESVKNRIDLYNKEYLRYDNKTMENFYSKKLDANLFLRQIEGIKHKVEGLNLPLFYKSQLTHISDQDEQKMRKITELDKQIMNLDRRVIKKFDKIYI